ncbi:mCG126367 [Mus musculus]|nr:mCG126367 [Mus musculus]
MDHEHQQGLLRQEESTRPLEVAWTTDVFQGDLIQKTDHSSQTILFRVSVCSWAVCLGAGPV